MSQDLCIREMIVRSAKHILRGILFETSLPFLAPTIAQFFNCLLSRPERPDTSGGKKKKKKKVVRKGGFGHTPSTLWSALVKMVSDRFHYDVPPEKIAWNEVRYIQVELLFMIK